MASTAKALIRGVFQERPGESLTVKEIHTSLAESKTKVTVYNALREMVSDGEIQEFRATPPEPHHYVWPAEAAEEVANEEPDHGTSEPQLRVMLHGSVEVSPTEFVRWVASDDRRLAELLHEYSHGRVPRRVHDLAYDVREDAAVFSFTVDDEDNDNEPETVEV